ncbi:penicillin-binding protein activator, partial [Escherichia coli]
MFQFGLAAEDEARAVASRAWGDGMRRAVALVPRGEWGDRVLAAFSQ